MKQFLLIALVSITASTFAFGHVDRTDPDGPVSDEATIRKLIDDLASALTQNDTDALSQLYTEDFTLVNPLGILLTKEQSLGDLRSKAVRFEFMKHDDIRIRIYGESAVATARVTVKGSNSGGPMAGTSRNTLTFVKMQGKWKLAATQATSMAFDQ